MRYCDLDRSDKNLWLYQPAHDKTEWARDIDAPKIVPIGPKAIAIIESRSNGVNIDPQDFIFRPCDTMTEKRKSKRTPYQVKRDNARKRNPKERLNDHYSVYTYCRAIKRAAIKAGVPSWTPYQLRHTAATEVEKQFGWRGAQILLGHKNPNTTKVYVDQNKALAHEIAKKRG